MILRVQTWRRGERICRRCGGSLEGFKRSAAAHPHCAREIRRERQKRAARSNGRAGAGAASQGGTNAADGVSCPRCGSDLLMVRIRGWVTLTDDRHARRADDFAVTGRKQAFCLGCEWSGTVARARVAA